MKTLEMLEEKFEEYWKFNETLLRNNGVEGKQAETMKALAKDAFAAGMLVAAEAALEKIRDL